MGRKKQFKVEDTLAKAMEVFSARGYHATSILDLAAGTGMSRSNVYASLGDKHTVFLRVLRHYAARWQAHVRTALAEPLSPRQAISSLLASAIAETGGDDSWSGCGMLMNTALELTPYDAEVKAIVERAFADLEQCFRAAIVAGQTLAEIPRRVAPDLTARSLLTLLIGWWVLVRSRGPGPLRRSIVQQVDDLLG